MQQLNRSNSIFGTLKSIVSTAVPWFGSTTYPDDLQGKRKQAVIVGTEVEEGSEPRTKRTRVHSPEPDSGERGAQSKSSRLHVAQAHKPSSGYLDPPIESFQRHANGGQRQMGHARAASAAAPTIDRTARRGMARGRTASPSHTTVYAPSKGLSRTLSMDPPPRQRSVSVFESVPVPRPISRDVSMESIHDRSESPSVRPFRMRTSMTPQPSIYFGPARGERETSEPPPLHSLIENPVFVKAPSQPPPDRQDAGEKPSITLGSMAEAQRTVRPLKRTRSSLMLDDLLADEAPKDEAEKPALEPTSSADKVLRELEVYKTPLLPTRLQGKSMPKTYVPPHKKARMPLLMHDRERKPRLGTIEKARERDRKLDPALDDTESPRKPYAGRGGMKKLLARRRMEEEEAHHQARLMRLSVIEETEEEGQEQSEGSSITGSAAHELDVEEEDRQPTRIGGREQSSLRVGRKRGNRNHIPRPTAKRAGRFSATFEEDEDSMMMDEESEREWKELEEAAKKAPTFNPPPSFSFAMNTPPPIKPDANDKEPPITTLPFSLTKTPTQSVSSTSSKSSSLISVDKPTSSELASASSLFSFAQGIEKIKPPVVEPAASLSVAAPAPLTPVIKTAPELAAAPPAAAILSAESAASQLSESMSQKSSSAIPNFFANSAIFTKPSVQNATAGTQTIFSLVPPTHSAVDKEEEKPQETTAAPSFFANGKAPEPEKREAKLPTFSSTFGAPARTGTITEKPAAPNTSVFGGEANPALPSTTSTASAPAVAAPPSLVFAVSPVLTLAPAAELKAPALATPARASSAPAFTFGAPAKSTETPTAPSPTPSPFTFGASSKPAEPTAPSLAPSSFLFGAPTTVKAETGETKPTTDAATTTAATTSIFGAASQSKPAFTFGTPIPATGGAATPEPPTSPFTFGQSVAQPAAATTESAVPTIQAPKPLFGGTSGFTFGQPPAASAPTATTEPPKSPFTFGAPATSAPTANKKPFVFGTPSPAPPATPPAAGVRTSTSLFGGAPGTAITTDTAPKPFTFGAPPATPTPAAPARTVTPPKNGDMMMDESPIRSVSMDVNSAKPEALKLNGFTFGASPASPSPFGQPAANTSTPFTFGNVASTATSFGAKPAETKPVEKPALTFAFGQPSTATGFSFGQKVPEAAPAPAATTTAGFPFGSPATPTTPASPYTFGAPPLTQSTSFGQPTSAISTTAPTPFGQAAQPSGFSFSTTPTSATASSNPFTFGGSQPASPASANTGLPSQPATTGFSFPAPTSAGTSTASPFGAVGATAALPAAGTATFTMGAAPPPAPGGPRPMRKMPVRRGGKR